MKVMEPLPSREKKRRIGMSDILILAGVVIAWLLLTQWVLPKLGVPT